MQNQQQILQLFPFYAFVFVCFKKKLYLCMQIDSLYTPSLMKHTSLFFVLCTFVLVTTASAQPRTDWAGFHVYADSNARLLAEQTPVSVVFYGNSITQIWYELRPEFFTSHGFVGRGIGGQTTSELLVRMRADVIDLHPETVVIMCGTNDIAQNNGVIAMEHTVGNIISMCQLAKANGIRPILCSALPARSFYWNPSITGVPEQIRALNERIRAYAQAEGILYVDYYSAMVAEDGGLRTGLSNDEVHPTDAGYEVMEPIILAALAQ